MTNKSDKPLVRNMIIFCTCVVLLFHLAWAKLYFVNLGKPIFTIIDLLLLVAFIYWSWRAYTYADDPKKDRTRYVVIAITILSSLWAAGWSAGLNERINL